MSELFLIGICWIINKKWKGNMALPCTERNYSTFPAEESAHVSANAS